MIDHRTTAVGAAVVVTIVVAALVSSALADGDAANFSRLGFDDQFTYCMFMETAALRDEYADRGLRFRGPAPLDGGGVLGTCAFFLVTGITPPNFLGFNATAEYADGGIPRDPQTILFDPPADFVRAQVGSYVEVGFPATMTAWDADDQLLASATVSLARQTVPLLIEAAGIARVEVTAPDARYLLDDLLWGASAGGDLALDPAEVTLAVAAGQTTSRELVVTSRAAVPLEFFLREHEAADPAGRAAAAPATVRRLGDPVAPANLATGQRQLPAAVLPRASVRDAPSLLVYTEIDPNGSSADTDLDQALRSLDIPYTGVYGSIPFFREQLTNATWDAVIFDHQAASIPSWDLAVFDELLVHVDRGGRLIACTWQIADVPDHPLWTRLGFTWLEDYESPIPVVWTQEDPRVFDVPNDVPVFTELQDLYLIDGHRLAAAADAVVLAREGGRLGPPLMVRANDGRTVYRGFLDGNNTRDRDADGVLDAVELWRGLLLNTFGADVPWLAGTPEAVVPAGGATAIDLVLDATGLVPGEYRADLELRSNEAVHRSYRLPVMLTVTADPTGASPPAAGLALSAHPNPFNPTTTVTFALPRTVPVTLRVLSPRGRLVRTLLAGEELAAGDHARAWDGRDAAGRPAAAGTYLLELRTPEARRTHRLSLVR